jgi:hypothetical protein
MINSASGPCKAMRGCASKGKEGIRWSAADYVDEDAATDTEVDMTDDVKLVRELEDNTVRVGVETVFAVKSKAIRRQTKGGKCPRPSHLNVTSKPKYLRKAESYRSKFGSRHLKRNDPSLKVKSASSQGTYGFVNSLLSCGPAVTFGPDGNPVPECYESGYGIPSRKFGCLLCANEHRKNSTNAKFRCRSAAQLGRHIREFHLEFIAIVFGFYPPHEIVRFY